MARGFLYLVAVLDWYSRKILAWRVSNSLTADFSVEALEEAIARYGRPQIFNSDQGSQFTAEFIGVLNQQRIRISMDGRGAWRDNVFVERLWKSIKYEEVYLHAYESVSNAKPGIGRNVTFYNSRRPHRSLDRQTPDACTADPCRSRRQPEPRSPTYPDRENILNLCGPLSPFQSPSAAVVLAARYARQWGGGKSFQGNVSGCRLR
jgi:putative transposase